MKWMSFCPFDVMSRKTKRKNHFSFKLYRQASCVDVSREQSWPVNCKFLKKKSHPVDLANQIINDNDKSKNKLLYYCDEQKKFSCKLKNNYSNEKKESWIIDNKYFNCESMALCLQRKASIRKLICNKKTKELHLEKMTRPILEWLF